MNGQDTAICGETFRLQHSPRQFPRYELIVPVQFAFDVAGEAKDERGLSQDIGMGGLGIISLAAAELRKDDLVTLRLSAHGIEGPLLLTGLVVYTIEDRGFGLWFPPLMSPTRMRLKRLLTVLAGC